MKAFINCLFVLTILLASSCLKTELKPQEPIWGKQACDNCRMILSEKRFAAQRVLPSGQIFYYDDLNCAIKHQHGKNEGILYVRPYGDEIWVEAEKAKYQSGLMTPMNSGYGAVKEGGTIEFSEIKQKLQDQ